MAEEIKPTDEKKEACGRIRKEQAFSRLAQDVELPFLRRQHLHMAKRTLLGRVFTPRAFALIAQGWLPEVFRRLPTLGTASDYGIYPKGVASWEKSSAGFDVRLGKPDPLGRGVPA